MSKPELNIAYANGTTIHEMRDLIPSSLNEKGDARLVWVSESDLCEMEFGGGLIVHPLRKSPEGVVQDFLCEFVRVGDLRPATDGIVAALRSAGYLRDPS